MSQYIAAPLQRGESGLGEFPLNKNIGDLKVADIIEVDLTARDAVEEWRRSPYISCYVISEDKTYRLGADITIAGQVWTEIIYTDPNALVEADVFDADGYFLPSKMRNLFINDQFVVADEAAMLALTSVIGNVFIRLDDGSVWIKLNNDDPSDITDFAEITGATGAVTSVNGMTGAVSVTIANLLANPTNLTDFDAAVASNALVLSHSASIASLTTNKADLVAGTVPLSQLPYVFQSGITRSTNEVKLGGNLLYDTTIGVSTFNMVIDASTAGNFGINFGSDQPYDLIFRNSSGYLDRLPKGADGQVLKTNGGVLVWGAGGGGGGGGWPLTGDGTLTGDVQIFPALADDNLYDISIGFDWITEAGGFTKNFFVGAKRGIFLNSYDGVSQNSLTIGGTFGTSSWNINAGFWRLTDGRAGAAAVGLEYSADYSDNYTSRSLVDKEFVWATKGNTTLTANSLIDGAFNVDFGTSTELTRFRVRTLGFGNTGKLDLTSSIALFGMDDSTGDFGAAVTANAQQSRFLAYDLVDTVQIIVGTETNGGMLVQSTDSTFAGLKYFADYSANYTSRSLIDKGYADTTYGGGAFWKVTGTTNLTGAVTVAQAGFNTTFSGTGKVTFSPSATLAGFNWGSVASDPSGLSDGDAWFNTTQAHYKIRATGSTNTLPRIADTGAAVTGGIPYAAVIGSSFFNLSANLTFNGTGLFVGGSGFTIQTLTRADIIGVSSGHSLRLATHTNTTTTLVDNIGGFYIGGNGTLSTLAVGITTGITASTRVDIRGTGTGSNSTLRLADSGNALILNVRDDKTIQIPGTVTSGGTTALSLSSQVALAGSGIDFTAGNTAQFTSGNWNNLLVRVGFAPTSGTATFSSLNVQPVINQTGGANGQVTISNGNPTITAAVNVTGYDWNPTTPANITGTHLAFRSTSGNWAMQGSATTLTLGGGATASELRFLEPSGSGANYTAFKAVAQGADITYSLPPTVGAAGTVLTDVAGNGVLTWVAGGGGGGWAVTGNTTITGNTSQTGAFTNTFALDNVTITQNALTSPASANRGFTFTGGAHTSVSAGVPTIDVDFNFNRTVQMATGAVTLARSFVIQPVTWSAVAASVITDAATFELSAPKASTNITITNSHAILVRSVALAGTITNSYGITINAHTGATNNYSAQFLGGNGVVISNTGISTTARLLELTQAANTGGSPTVVLMQGGSHTGLTAATNSPDLWLNFSRTVQYSTGGLSLYTSTLLNAPTIGFVGASTLINAAALYINNPVIAGTNAAITNSHGIYIASLNSIGAGVTNGYGLTVNSPTGATDNWAAQFLGGHGLFIGDAASVVSGNPTNGAYFYSDPTTHLPMWKVPGGTTYDLSALGSGSFSRTISSISSNTTAGASATTDYVYKCTSTFTLTMPTAVGNTNRYTIKNVGSGTITVDTTSSQTIDGDLTWVLNTNPSNILYGDSIDLVSDGSNWILI